MRPVLQRLADAWRARLADDQDPFRAAVVLLIALLTVLTTALAALQVDASSNAAIAARRADVAEAAAAGTSTGGLIQTNADLGVYRRWLELRFDTVWAQRATGSDPAVADDGVDAEMAAALLRIDRELGEWVRRQSLLLQPPYQPDGQSPIDIATLDAERNTGPQVRAGHEARIAAEEAASWARRAADDVTAITVVAVGLFFLGLAAALRGPGRRILATSGVAFGLAALAAAVLISARPIPTVPGAAVDALVDSAMAASRAAWAGGTGAVDAGERETWRTAIAAADRAVALAPDYAPGVLARADAQLRYAHELVLGGGPGPTSSPGTPGADEAGPLLAQALADYRRSTAIDGASATAWWNLGWAAYLAGDPVTAVAAADRALALSPDQFSIVLNRALARLAAGDIAGYQADLDAALSLASSVTLDSNGWFFARNDYDIGRLAVLRPGEALQLREAQRRIREAAVAARIRRVPGAASPGTGAGSITGITIRPLRLDEDVRLVEQAAIPADGSTSGRGVAGFRIVVAGRDIGAGRTVSVRAWENGLESPEYRVDRPWPDDASEVVIDLVSPYGRMGQAVDPAAYEVAVYLDAETSADQRFHVVEAVVRLPATAFVRALEGSGHTCGAPRAAGGDGRTATACVLTGFTREDGLEAIVTSGPSGTLDGLDVSVPASLPGADGVIRRTGAVWFSVLLPEPTAREASDWLARATPGEAVSLGGLSFSLSSTPGGTGRITLAMRAG